MMSFCRYCLALLIRASVPTIPSYDGNRNGMKLISHRKAVMRANDSFVRSGGWHNAERDLTLRRGPIIPRVHCVVSCEPV